MLKRRYGTSLSRAARIEEDVNPSAYLVNLTDCMLVLLLGAVVALIAYFNVDLTQPTEPEDEIIGVQVNMDENNDGIIDDEFSRRGSVYYDNQTGEFYYVSE